MATAVILSLLPCLFTINVFGQFKLLHQQELSDLPLGEDALYLAKNGIYMLYEIESKKIQVIYFDFEAKSKSLLTLKVPQAYGGMDGFAVNQGKLLLLTNNQLLLYELNNGKLLSNVENNLHFDEVIAYKEHFLVYKNYNYHPLGDSIKTAFGIYDIIEKKVTIARQETFDFYPATHRVQKFISVAGDNILFAHTLSYKVYVFNDQLQKIDSLIRSPREWMAMRSDLRDSIQNAFSSVDRNNVGIKNLIYAFYREDEKISRIEKVAGTDSIIIVSYKHPHDGWEQRHIDFYRLNTGQWALVDQQTIVIEGKSNDSTLFTHQPRFADSDPFVIVDDKIILFSRYFLELPINLTYDQYNAYRKNHTLKNDQTYGLYIFSIGVSN